MGVLNGVRVVELGMWLAGPVAAGVMADWGADVVKVEPLGGDPMRELYGRLSGSKVEGCPPFDTFNRGKRSLALDINTEEGRDALERVLDQADVFLTNMRASFLRRVGLDADAVLGRHPGIVYATLSGYGPSGPDKDAPGFDVAAFTARSGIGERMQPAGAAPMSLPGGMGDVVSGMSLVAGVVGALFQRERTGRGQVVSTSLLRCGIFSIGMDVSARVGLGRVAPVKTREQAPNPLMNCYAASDGSWFWLMGAESERHWPRLVACLDDEALSTDERFGSARDRRRNGPELVAILDGIFARRTRDEWSEAFAEHDVWWAPVNAVDDLLADQQVIASGAFGPISAGVGGMGVGGMGVGGMSAGEVRMAEQVEEPVVASPVDFSADPIRLPRSGPVLGADTAAVLAEAGLDRGTIDALAAAGVIRGEARDG